MEQKPTVSGKYRGMPIRPGGKLGDPRVHKYLKECVNIMGSKLVYSFELEQRIKVEDGRKGEGHRYCGQGGFLRSIGGWRQGVRIE